MKRSPGTLRYKTILISYAMCGLISPAVMAQSSQEDTDTSEIVVTASRIRGAVETSVPPIQELNETDIAAVGASSVTDLLTALAPQAGSGRGRGGGQPVVLLNGQRISGFRELRDLPPEAIKQVQVFPEEVALQYGYRPDQRVINFILKDNFASFNAEIESGAPQDGGYATYQSKTTLTSIGKSTRINIDAEYEHASRLTETERGIRRDSADGVGSVPITFDGDIGSFRTLLPLSDRFEINGTVTKSLAPQTTLSANANYRLDDTQSLLGLPNARLILPGSSPFSRTGSDAVINRYFTAPRALTRDSEIHTAKLGFSFNTLLGNWRLSATGDYAHTDTQTSTVRNADFSELRQSVLSGSTDPFAPGFGDSLLFLAPDLTRSIAQNLNLANTLSGDVLTLPSGRVRMTVRAGYVRETLDSRSERGNVTGGDTINANVINSANLRRNTASGTVNVEIPLVDRGVGALGFLGEVAMNGNYGLSQLSDFGRLTEYTAGIRWSPAKGLTFTASMIGDENAPGIAQLGNPILATSGVPYFDFTRGETALISTITGGNRDLVGEKRRDLKLSANWTPAKIENLNVQIEYFRNRSRNTTGSFVLITPELEAAFPGRIVRDSGGRLISADFRPVNYDAETSQSVRWGLNFSGTIGPERRDSGGGPRNGAPIPVPAASPQRRDAGSGGASFGRGGFGGGGFGAAGGRQQGRWQIATYHTYQIEDQILIRSGVPRLDLLRGSATGNLGGTPRHRIELSGGIFNKGLGLRVSANYRSKTRADGNALNGNGDLRFSDLMTMDLRFFVNLDDRGSLTKKAPFLKGMRIALNIDNALNDSVKVRNAGGIVPVSYQRGYLDPKGRFFELSLRKRF